MSVSWNIYRRSLNSFVHESCGKCTPCRLGTTRILELLTDFVEGRLRTGMWSAWNTWPGRCPSSACGLGQSVNVALMSASGHRRGDFEAHINGGACLGAAHVMKTGGIKHVSPYRSGYQDTY